MGVQGETVQIEGFNKGAQVLPPASSGLTLPWLDNPVVIELLVEAGWKVNYRALIGLRRC